MRRNKAETDVEFRLKAPVQGPTPRPAVRLHQSFWEKARTLFLEHAPRHSNHLESRCQERNRIREAAKSSEREYFDTMNVSGTQLARRIDLTSLQLFVAVCELGSIGKAAEREFIAASAVSKRLRISKPRSTRLCCTGTPAAST